jgi:hypothetical protein
LTGADSLSEVHVRIAPRCRNFPQPRHFRARDLRSDNLNRNAGSHVNRPHHRCFSAARFRAIGAQLSGRDNCRRQQRDRN